MIQLAIACLFFLGMAVVKTYPLVFCFASRIPLDPGDPLLNTWILSWDFHALTTEPWNLFQTNTFYPAENSLAFSEHLLGLLPIFAPAYALTDNPIFAYNVVFFLSFPLSGIAMFLLVRHWTQSFWASLLAGSLFAFSPIRFGQLGHLQLLNLYWAPLAFLFLDRFLHGKRWRDVLYFAVFYWLQVLSSVYLGWFTTLAVALYVLHYAMFIDRKVLRWAIWPQCATFFVLSLLILFPLHLPYFQVKRLWGSPWGIAESVPYSADLLLSYVSASYAVNDLYASLLRFATSRFGGWEKWLFPGFVLPLLVVFGSCSSRTSLVTDRMKEMRQIFGVLMVTSFILSLGPYLVLLDSKTHIPLPYYVLYRLVPGFGAMRVPARFGFMALLAASVLAALGYLKVCAHFRRRWAFWRAESPACHAVVGVLCLSLFALELGRKPLPLVTVQTKQEVPEVYRWLATRKLNGPIVELPVGLWEDFRYMYFSTYHWLPIVNGATGFIPPTYFQILPELHDLPSRQGVESLSAIGVRGLVVHHAILSPDKVSQWRSAKLAEIGLEKVAEFGSDAVYRIVQTTEPTRQLQVELVAPEQLPTGLDVSLDIIGRGADHRAWRHPQPLGRTIAVAEWEEQQTARRIVQQKKLVLPLFIRADEVTPIGLQVRTPSAPGRYTLKIRFPSLRIATDAKVMEIHKQILDFTDY